MPHTEQKKELVCQDGYHIAYRYFSSGTLSEKASSPAIILLHRENNFPQGLTPFIRRLCLPEYRFLSLEIADDALSHCREKKASNISIQTSHFQEFFEYAQSEYNIKATNVVIISFDEYATVVSSWVIDYAPNIRCAILYSPMFLFTIYDALSAYLKGNLHNLYRKLFTKKRSINESEQGRSEDVNLLNFNAFPSGILSWRSLADILFTGRRITRSTFSYPTSTQVFISEKEGLTSVCAQLKFYASIGSDKKELIVLPAVGGRYQDRDSMLLAQTRDFIVECFSKNINVHSLFNSYKEGVTKDEYEKLRLPETNLIKSAYWAVNKLALKHIGKLSDGIQLGLETGFDSGASLDYIYRNTPSGKNVLGRAIDNYYLSNIGWHCTRMRKRHVEALMVVACQRLSEEQKTIRFLDIAAGHGSYIISTIEKMQYPIAHVLMRDFEQSNVLNGEKLIQQNNLAELVTFEQGDAFSSQDLITLPQDRTLTIVSGFYELFSDNRLVLDSLNGIAHATELGGYLIYTTKLWNPKLDYMARVLTSHKQGEHWLLRRRTQLEIDQLVNQAGFVKITQRIDPWGMFSVAMAKKIAQ
jgi:alpha-beta hydrolase superfamily lysophospholipase